MKRDYPLSDEEYKQIYSKVTRVVVGLVIRNDKGILLAKRRENGWVGQWHIPGGMIHYREKVSAAVQRIAKEELGIPVKIHKLLGYIEYFSEEATRGYGYTVGIVFDVGLIGDKYLEGDDYDEKKFFIDLPKNTVEEEYAFLSSIAK